MSEVDKHLSLPSLYGYQLAIGQFRVVKGGGESYPRFPSEFGDHGLSLCLLDFSTRIRLGFGWPSGGEDCSLESPEELRRRPGM
jgi:hypothetical protein